MKNACTGHDDACLEVEVWYNSYLGEISSNLIRIWTCGVVYVTDEGAVLIKRRAATFRRNVTLRSDVT